MVRARIAGSSASGMPALTSSMWAPASTCASVSALTRSKLPAAISAASSLRPVGLIRSPMMTNGRSNPMTTSWVAELTTVSVTNESSLNGRFDAGWNDSRSFFDTFLLSVALGKPRHPAAENAGAFDDLGHRLLLPISHHVHAGNSRDLAQLMNQVDTQAAALDGLVLRACQTSDDRVGDVNSRHVRAHPLGRLGRSQRSDSGQHEHLLEQSQVCHPLHEFAHHRNVEAILSLDELGTGGDLLGQPLGAPVERQRERVLGRTQKHARRVTELAS